MSIINTAKKTIVFDLDGTLINSAPDVRHALNRMLDTYQLPAVSGDEIYDLIGLGANALIIGAFAKFGIEPDETQIAQAKAQYIALYRERPVVDSYIYPQVVATLEALQGAGYQFGICTNKPSTMTHLVLETLQLKSYFPVILSGDEVKQPKPHGQHILDVLAKFSTEQSAAFMVGDSIVDQTSAEAANIPFIGVTYGYSREPITSQHLIDHFQELPLALDKVLSDL